MTKTKVKERPILFTAEMVRAILDGMKSMTRRAVKKQPNSDEIAEGVKFNNGYALYGREYRRSFVKCPYGKPRDRLWVREAFAEDEDDHPIIFYRATDHEQRIRYE